MFFDAATTKFNVINVLRLNWEKSRVNLIGNCNSYHAITYRFRAKSVFNYDDKTIDVREHSVLYMPPYCKFTKDADEDEEVITVYFEAENVMQDEINVFYPENYELYERLFTELYNVCESKSYGYRFKMNEYMYRILYMILNEEMHREKSGNLCIAERASQLIEKEISNAAFSVDNIAEFFGISKTHLRVSFKEFYGISPKEYQIKSRMQLAESLIRSEYFTVKQIAEKCGYADDKYFSTCFKSYYGVSPKKF